MVPRNFVKFPFSKIVAAGGIVNNDKNEILFIFGNENASSKVGLKKNISLKLREFKETGARDLIIENP